MCYFVIYGQLASHPKTSPRATLTQTHKPKKRGDHFSRARGNVYESKERVFHCRVAVKYAMESRRSIYLQWQYHPPIDFSQGHLNGLICRPHYYHLLVIHACTCTCTRGSSLRPEHRRKGWLSRHLAEGRCIEPNSNLLHSLSRLVEVGRRAKKLIYLPNAGQ